MHIWQAIKMACKSLWTNKLRSFLTMLGIIIGVMTVALLTSVASGVQRAVISQIRTQSTLSIIMNTSANMKKSNLSKILNEEQPEKTAEDYYEYSIVKNVNAVVSKDLTGISNEVLNEDESGFLFFETLKSYTQAQIDAMTSPEEKMFAQMHNARKKARPKQSSIYAVDANFADVYSLEFTGTFPDANNEILVDEAFVKEYVGEAYDSETAIGEVVSIGVKYNNKIEMNFNTNLTEEQLIDICEYLEGKYVAGQDGDGKDILKGLNLTIIANDDDSKYVYDSANNKLTVSVQFFQNLTTSDLQGAIQGGIMSTITSLASAFAAENPVLVTDVYDLSNAKDYTISGVLKEGNSMFTGMGSGNMESTGFAGSMMELMLSHQKGTCYMLLDDRNLAPIGEEVSSVNDVVVSFAYLRYKTEDVMADSTTNLSLALMKNNYTYMSDFMVVSMSSVASIVDNVMDTLTIMLTVISIVSLIVGGIGIMNIMLVAVTERTREIGIRKAIGAKRSAILVQFLVEALMLSLVGGAFGLVISGVGCAIIGHFMGVAILMPFWVIAMSVGFCTLIGLAFGMFPAIKASKMQPIDALRRE